MRTGERSRGFSYLGLLFALALGGVALAALGERWQQATQREREAELLFRGLQIRDAIERYAAAGGGALPASLAQLLEDTRSDPPRHWLRRLYSDPFTTQPDWLLLPAPDGGIAGVASRSRQAALRRHALPVALAEGAHEPLRVGDWQFRARPPQTTTNTTEPRGEARDPDLPR